MNWTLDDVRAAARLLRESDLAEVSIESSPEDFESPAQRLLLRRIPSRAAAPTAAQLPTASGAPAPPQISPAESLQTSQSATGTLAQNIVSPAVGLFRHASPPLQIGDAVRAGQLLGVVESLKIPNEIHANGAARVLEILAGEGQGVEYGQVLARLEPIAEAAEELV